MSEPRARVERLLERARAVFGPGRSGALVDALANESGLSREGVVWALDHLLELQPSEGELAALLARGATSPRGAVFVVLSANVLTAPLRAIAWALAQSPRVLVRTSRRARVFVDALGEAGFTRVEEMDLATLPRGAVVHAYGGSAAIAAIASAARGANVPAELHGPGFAAIVADADALIAGASEVARDVVAFDQRGCLSPRIALAIGDGHHAAAAISRALGTLAVSIPRGTLTDAERAEIVRARDAALVAGTAFEGRDDLVLDLGAAKGLPLGPTGRVLPIVSVPTLEDALSRLRSIDTLTSLATPYPITLPNVRITPLGRLQAPPFDGPVDLRPMR